MGTGLGVCQAADHNRRMNGKKERQGQPQQAAKAGLSPLAPPQMKSKRSTAVGSPVARCLFSEDGGTNLSPIDYRKVQETSGLDDDVSSLFLRAQEVVPNTGKYAQPHKQKADKTHVGNGKDGDRRSTSAESARKVLREAGGFEAFGIWYNPQKERIEEWEGVPLRSPSPSCNAAGAEMLFGDLPRVERKLPVVSYPEFERPIATARDSPYGWLDLDAAFGNNKSSKWRPGTPVWMETLPEGGDGQSIHEFFVVQGEDLETTELDRSRVDEFEWVCDGYQIFRCHRSRLTKVRKNGCLVQRRRSNGEASPSPRCFESPGPNKKRWEWLKPRSLAEATTTELEVARASVPHLVGRGGRTVADLEETLGIIIGIADSQEENRALVTLIGPEDRLQAAKHVVEAIAKGARSLLSRIKAFF